MKLKNSTSIPADKNHKPTNVKEDLSNDQVKQENLKKTRRKKQSKQTENNVTSNSSMSDTGSSADINSPGKGEVEQVWVDALEGSKGKFDHKFDEKTNGSILQCDFRSFTS